MGNRVVTLGEIMLRLKPPGFERFFRDLLNVNPHLYFSGNGNRIPAVMRNRAGKNVPSIGQGRAGTNLITGNGCDG